MQELNDKEIDAKEFLLQLSNEGNKKWTKNLNSFESVAYVGDDNEEDEEENDPFEESLSQPVPHAGVRPLNPSRSFSQPDYIYYPDTVPRRNHENGEGSSERRKKKTKRNTETDIHDNGGEAIEKTNKKRKREDNMLEKGLERNNKRAKISKTLKSKAKKKKV